MEKLIYLLWREPQRPPAAWRARWLDELAPALQRAGALDLQFNLVDEDVEPGAALRIVTQPPVDGFTSFWLRSANERAGCEALLREAHARIAGYLVTESTVQDGAGRRAPGRRSEGFSLIGFLRRPAAMSERDWLRVWLEQHTPVALATQASFRYVQNVVARVLTDDAPPLDALVEEGFPAAVLTSPHAFYDAEGDEAKYQERLQRMMESVRRFIDFNEINSLPTSEYLIAPAHS